MQAQALVAFIQNFVFLCSDELIVIVGHPLKL